MMCVFMLMKVLVFAQQEPTSPRNNVYLTPGFLYSLSLSYERQIRITERSTSMVLRFLGGVGARIYEFEGPIGAISLGWIRGQGKHHFEYGAGIAAEIDNSGYANRTVRFWPAGNIGYRYRKPSGRFVFRAGAGWPEAAYVSVGSAF